jgi:class 3 adenylate cyclase
VIPAASEPTLDLIVPLSLSDASWSAHAGDDPAFADPAFDASHWQPSDTHAWASDPELRGSTIVWYRAAATLQIREGQELAVGAVGFGAWEVYLNGHLVLEHGAVGGYVPALRTHVATVPPGVVGPDGHVVVAVREWCPPWWLLRGGDLGDVAFGDAPVLARFMGSADQFRRANAAPTEGAGAIAAMIGLVHLFLFVRRREMRAYLWFGVGTVGLGVNLLLFNGVWSGAIPPVPLFDVLTVGTNAVGFGALLMFLAAFFGYRPALARGVTAALCVRNAFILVPAVGVSSLPPLSLYALVAVSVAYVVAAVVSGVRRRLPGARIVAAGVVWFLLWPIELVALVAGVEPAWFDPWRGLFDAVVLLGLLLAMVVGLAERFASSLDEIEAAYAASRRFVPFEFLERLGRRTVTEVERGDTARLEMTVLFFDIRGFTTLAEAHPVEQTFELLNALFDRLEPLIRARQGFLIQFTGDGFLALFADADGAVHAAVDMARAVEGFTAPALDGGRLRVGMGLHTGTLMLGTLGGRDQLLAAVVADAANLGSRVEGMTKLYGARVLISHVTRDRLADPGAFRLREVDRVVAKGRRDPIGLFEVLDAEDSARAEGFPAALARYRAGEFEVAAAAFAACDGDPAAAVLAERSRGLAAAPPTAWDGVFRLETK